MSLQTTHFVVGIRGIVTHFFRDWGNTAHFQNELKRNPEHTNARSVFALVISYTLAPVESSQVGAFSIFTANSGHRLALVGICNSVGIR